jgi:hypothetical protein
MQSCFYCRQRDINDVEYYLYKVSCVSSSFRKSSMGKLIQVDNFLENQARYRAFYIAIHQSKFFSKSKKEMLKNI